MQPSPQKNPLAEAAVLQLLADNSSRNLWLVRRAYKRGITKAQGGFVEAFY